ncbi:trichohyalin-like [Mya arenaria]|uniref:trichohyalin-like n=1 Tax=Mya arenaria TaxID=6604 RepID=UPI0022E981B9|nr:trichohyalin-like [Mya arenaria]
MSSSRMSIPGYSSTQGDRNSLDGISRLDSQNSQRGGQGQNGLGQRTKSSAELGSKAYIKEYQRRYSKHVEDGRPSTSYLRLSENKTDQVGGKHSQLPVLPHTTNSKSKPKDRLNKMNYPIQVKIKYHGEERHTEPTFNGEEDEGGEEHVNDDNQDHRRETEDVDDAEATKLLVRFENYLQAFGHDDVTQLDDEYVKNKYEEFFQEMEEELDSRIKENNERNENNRGENKLDKLKGLTNIHLLLERNRKQNPENDKQMYQVKLRTGISEGKYTSVNEEYLTKSPDTEEILSGFEDYLKSLGHGDDTQLDPDYIHMKYEKYMNSLKKERKSRKNDIDRNEDPEINNEISSIQSFKGKNRHDKEENLIKSPESAEILSGFENYLKSFGHGDTTQLKPDYIHMKYEKYMNNLKKERKQGKNGVYKKDIDQNEDPKITHENSLIQTFKGKSRQDDKKKVMKSPDTAEILSGFENYLKSLGHCDSTQLEPEYVHERYEKYMNRLKEKRSLQQNGVYKKENQIMGMVLKDVPHADQRQELQAILSELLQSRNQEETKAKESDNSENAHVGRDQNEILSGFQNYLKSSGCDDISYLDEDYVKAEFKDYLKEIDEEGKAIDRGMDKRRKGENRSNEVKASKRNLFQNSQLKNTGKSTLAHEERNLSIVEDNRIIIHLHTDSFNRISPPPSVPTGLDFDQGSITSNEPDLELTFDDVIDVEQLEGIDAIEQIDPEEYERKMKEERERKRKHKQKKRRKKRDAGKDITAEIAESGEVKHGQDMEDDNIDPNENKNVGEHSQKQKKHKRRHKKYVERDDEMDDYIDDYADNFDEETAEEVKDLDCIKGKSERNMVSVNVDNDTDDEKPVNDNIMEKENSNVSTNTDLDSRKGRTKKKQRKLKPKKTECVGKETKADRNNSKDRNVNMIDTSIDANEKLVAEKKTEKKKKTRKNKSKERNAGKKKASKKRPSMFGINVFDMENAETAHAKLGSEAVSDYEIEIEKLPSIRNQLAKILGPTLEKQIADNEKHDESEVDEIPGNESDDQLEDTNEIETKDEEDKGNENQYQRPLSARLDDVLGDNEAMRKKYRSMSLPLQSDVEKLIKNMKEMSVEELKKPIHIPVYLPAFPQRKIIMKKQFKSNPKRVVHQRRGRSMSVFDLQEMLPWQLDIGTILN